MDIHRIKGIEINGVVACIPANILPTRSSCLDLYGEKGVETLIKATGIEARAVATEGTTTQDLFVTAAKELMEKTGTPKEEIGGVICVTFSPAYIMPADAPCVADKLGLSKDIFAFDINLACSGYGYGLYVASLFARQTGCKVLLLDGDIQTAYVSRSDKATTPVLSDCGSATIVSPVDNGDEWRFAFYTDGSLNEALYIPAGGSKNRISGKDVIDIKYEDGSLRKNADMYMNGFEVFKFVSMAASRNIKEFMTVLDITNDNLDIFVPHQANIYMVGELTKKLKIDKAKMWKSGDKYGNPGSSSVPLTIAENAGEFFKNNCGENTLFSGFGGGMSISIANIRLNKNGYYKVLKYNGEE